MREEKGADASPATDAEGTKGSHRNEWYNQDFGGYKVSEQPIFTKRAVRMICVGAGAMGLQLAYKADRLLEDVTLRIYEKNDDIGGVWLTNNYPGVACDLPSHSYQYPWARNPSWSRFYSPGKEIWQYLKDTATKFDLERHIKFSHRVEAAKWDDEEGVWRLSIRTPSGGLMEDECEILVNGTGLYSTVKWPDVPGIESFKGKLMHSTSWDTEYDLSGKTVAVIGSGPAGLQIVPSLQPVVKKLKAVIRTPQWIAPGFGLQLAGPGGTNPEYSEEQIASFRNDPQAYVEYCRHLENNLYNGFETLLMESKGQRLAREAVLKLMSDRLNGKKELVEFFKPNFGLGCRRLAPGPGFLESLTKDNVEAIRSGVVRFTEKGFVDEDGREHEVDAIVCSTGYDVDFVPPFECIGLDGVNLKEKFGDFPKGYLSIAVDDFPNMFFFFGPNAPSSHFAQLNSQLWHTRYLFQMINKLQRENIKSFNPKRECVEEFTQHAHAFLKRTSWSDACRAWYKLGKLHGPVAALWPGNTLHYCEALKEPRYEDYHIVYRGKNRFQYMGNGFSEEDMRPDGNMSWYFDDPWCKV